MNKREIPCRTIDLIGTVDDKMLYEFAEKMRAIHDYDMELYEYNSRMMPQHRIPYETIRINLSTPGGSVMAGTAIMGIMDEQVAPIHVHVIGSCMSMGISILAHAQSRSATKFSSFMIHGMSTGTWGYLDEGVGSLEYYKELERELNIELTKRTKYSLEELENYSNVAHFFGYQEALDKGLLTQDVYDNNPKPRFSREEFEECIMGDLEEGLTIDEIIKEFEKDDILECEWDIVLDILSEYEEYEVKDNILKGDEDDEVQVGDMEDEGEVESIEDENENEDDEESEDAIEIPVVYDVPEDMEMKNTIDVKVFSRILVENFEDLLPYIQGDYTAHEVAVIMTSMIDELADVDIEVIVKHLMYLNDCEE